MFKLRYTVGNKYTKDKLNSGYHFEVFGSREAIFDLWIHLTKRINPNAIAYPVFVEVLNTDGARQFPDDGLNGMFNSDNFYK